MFGLDKEETDEQIDRAFDCLFTMRTIPIAEYEELVRLAALGCIIEEAPSLVPDEIGGSVRIEFYKHDRSPVIVVESMLYPNRRFQQANVVDAWTDAKAAKR